MFTDGITEAKSLADEEFGTERLVKLLQAADCNSSKNLISAITSTVEKFRQFLAQQDDITVLCMLNRGVD